MPIDILDRALAAPIAGQLLLVERNDGHISTTDLDWWLRRDDARPPVDVALLDHVRSGPVLDVGCATGRHMELLAGAGIEVHGIDVCPSAIDRARGAGLSAEVADVHHFRPREPLHAVLALGGGIGLAGRRAHVPDLLARWASWLATDGMLAVSSINWTITLDKHREWVEVAHRAGRYPGEMRIRLRYGALVGEWFEWVWLDEASLEADCAQVGLGVERICRWGGWFGAVIRRRPA